VSDSPHDRSKSLVTALRAVVGEVEKEFEVLGRRVSPSQTSSTVDSGELAGVEDRLRRLHRHLRTLLPLSHEKGERMRDATPDPTPPSAAGRLAAIRLLLDSIENRVAQVLPSKTSGGRKYQFRGIEKMQDGMAIRADAQRLSRADVLVKWCCNGGNGVTNGQGKYTRRQVESSLAQDAGGHRRRRHLTGLDVGRSREADPPKTT